MSRKKDSSPHVPQEGKLKEKLTLRDFKWTDNQKKFLEIALAKDTRIMLVEGPAGTSKTMMAVYSALSLLSEKKISDIIYLRSAIESSDAKIGYLPGSHEEKMAVYNMPFEDKLHELLPKAQVEMLVKEAKVTAHPVNFTRGLSWNVKCLIFDECQNSSAKEIMTVLTRLGQFSRAFILADPMQSDLPIGKRGGSEQIFDLFNNAESRDMGIHVFRFTENDIMRSELVRFLVKKFRELE